MERGDHLDAAAREVARLALAQAFQIDRANADAMTATILITALARVVGAAAVCSNNPDAYADEMTKLITAMLPEGVALHRANLMTTKGTA